MWWIVNWDWYSSQSVQAIEPMYRATKNDTSIEDFWIGKDSSRLISKTSSVLAARQLLYLCMVYLGFTQRFLQVLRSVGTENKISTVTIPILFFRDFSWSAKKHAEYSAVKTEELLIERQYLIGPGDYIQIYMQTPGLIGVLFSQTGLWITKSNETIWLAGWLAASGEVAGRHTENIASTRGELSSETVHNSRQIWCLPSRFISPRLVDDRINRHVI